MSTQHEAVQQENKLIGLEVIRFFSALAVLFWHYQHFFYVADKPSGFIKERQPLYNYFWVFYEYGFYGVQVFWCISGFIFFWKYREAIASKIITPGKFFVLRFSRLYPLHLFTLILVVFFQAVYYNKKGYFFVYQNNDIPHLIYQFFLASNWGFEKGASFNGPVWSVSVESLVYVFFFLALQKIGKSFIVNVVVLLICLVATYFKVSSPIIDCLTYFYIGGLSAIALKYVQQTNYAKQISYASLFLLLASPIFAYITNIYQKKHSAELFLVFYTPVLLFFCARRLSVKPYIQEAIEAAGNMTYSSYLIHFPLQLAIAICFVIAEKEIPYYSEIFFFGFMLVTLVISFYTYILFELPAQNRIRKSWLSV